MDNTAIEKAIINCFVKKQQWYRKNIIKECLKLFNLTKEELNDTSPTSKLVEYSSLIGTQITRLLENDYLVIDQAKNITLAFDKQIVIQNLEIEQQIINYLNQGKLTKKAILGKLEQFFFQDFYNLQPLTPDFSNQVTTILKKLISRHVITLTDQHYQIQKINHFPNTSIGNCLNQAQEATNIYPYFIEAINLKGGEFFEQYVVNLIVRYYRMNKKIIHFSKVTGGSSDNGIDGVIESTDFLGFKETTLLQAKVRRSTHVTLKEVRDFYGALTAEKGSLGIFITNSYFHKEALKLINRLPNLVGIDNQKLFELATICQYGIITKNDKNSLDSILFL